MNTLDLYREVGRLRGALVRVAELFEDGAPDEAYEFAVAAAEPPPPPRRYVCEHCGCAFAWPGELGDHLDWVHWRGRVGWAA